MNKPSPVSPSNTYYEIELWLAHDYVYKTSEVIDPFDPSERVAIVRDPWTNEESEVPGGATFRFAVVVDCGKCWPEDESGFGVNEELRKLCESHFGQAFYEVVEVD